MATGPAYLMLLGSKDVIPHASLKNPMEGDGDADVPSDLPYACDKPYSADVQDFIAPTRVVGRLPDVTGGADSTYLANLLKTAATHTRRPASAYSGFLGVSAQVWKDSSALSLDAVFGAHADMKVSPPDGYKWKAAECKRLSHFFNCHGAPADPHFYGQRGASYPVAHSASWMNGKLAEATVMAAECCYGAELYDPSLVTAAGQMGMCNAYLACKAYAYFGSTTIAYGPAAANDQADLICQYFLQQILKGASAGRASLQARLQYVQEKNGVLTPTDLKTLAQFNLMADPSITPLAAPTVTAAVSLAAGPKNVEAAIKGLARRARLGRRKELETKAAIATAYRLLEPRTPPAAGKTGAFGMLRKLAREHGIERPDVVISFSVAAPRAAPTTMAKGFASANAVARLAPKAVHVILERRKPPTSVPRLVLIRGMQAVEYEEGMIAQPFESR